MNLLKTLSFSTRVGCIASLLASTPIWADSLPSALAETYRSNPDLQAARSSLYSTDETVAIARGGYRPNVSIDATASQSSLDGNGYGRGNVGLQLTQPLYDGAQTRNSVRGALSQVDSARANLLATEQNILLSAITAYLDVLRTDELVTIRVENLEFLRQQVITATTRFDLGDGTNTAVAQAQASEADSVAQLALAEAQASTSKANYRRIIGKAPVDLEPVNLPDSQLPKNLKVAIEQALQTHPDLLSVQALGEAARYDVSSSRGAFRPSLALAARLERTIDDLSNDSGLSQESTDSSISLSLNIPIYQAGLVSAQVRQARQIVNQRESQTESSRAQVQSDVESTWAQLNSARAAQNATAVGMDAALLAREGKLREQEVGVATTLDVLDSEQAVLQAKIASSSAEYDTVLTGYTLLANTGRLTVEALQIPVEPFDPEEHFNAVNRQWFGTTPHD